jgi:ADP-dependent NAD(P)H-hydrate dehydratase / NAD(P)H-hydrate epimerase
MKQSQELAQVVVTASQMAEIEGEIFAQGMPIPALMEKAGLLMAQRIQQLYPLSLIGKVGILGGSGHNGGDALVIARELFFSGYEVKIYQPLGKLKDLTTKHTQYAHFLQINFFDNIEELQDCEVIIDGLFGFGLKRSLSGIWAEVINTVNQWGIPVVSVDLPSGIHTDTGEVLGTAIKATYTLCLGLWKQACFQDQALAYLGKVERLDFGIPPQIVKDVLGEIPPVQIMTKTLAKKYLPLPRFPLTHKYEQGNVLLICGSSRYAGAAILSGLGARASGVGMLTIAAPHSLKLLLNSQLPEALVIPCKEMENGAIADISNITNLNSYDVIVCGMGLTVEPVKVIEELLKVNCPLILDADGLNIIAQTGIINRLKERAFSTILTPHLGEFKRLFPQIENINQDRIKAVKEASNQTNSIILLKGAKTLIADHNLGWIIPQSTPALARGGSGDVLSGLMGGLLAQNLKRNLNQNLDLLISSTVATAAFYHSQAGILAAENHTELGVDGVTLTKYLSSVFSNSENTQK